MASIFSKIAKGEIPAYKVAENENYLAFLDIFPLQKGHTLVIPKKEVDNIFDLSDAEYQGLMSFVKEVAEKIRKVIPCNRIGMTVIGLEVPHAHVHLIPINAEKDMNFSSKKLKLSPEEFESIAKRISEAN
jgi:histidine triad (HIT) family protein